MKWSSGIYKLTLFAFLMSSVSSVALGQEAGSKPQDASAVLAEKDWQKFRLKNDTLWNEFEQKSHQRWLKLKETVESKWDQFVDSTQKIWVDYGKDLDVRSIMDFENGTIEVTAAVPQKVPNVKNSGASKIIKQIKKLFSVENPAKQEILKDQLATKEGVTVTPKNLDQYIEQEIAPTILVEKKPYKAKDGVIRRKVKAEIHLVPNHIRIRAEKYINPVTEHCRRFKIMPQLIFSIIHTESYFNPLSKSSCGALGLMQLIPRYGAREAYQFIYKKDRILSAEYLYNPENNIELGTAYVHLLKYNHFGKFRETLKNRYLVVCGYNWGPSAVKKRVIQTDDIQQMDSSHLFSILIQRVPDETEIYLQKVTARMRFYDNLF